MANPKADRLIQFLTEQGITSPQVLAAIHALPREFFVAPAMMHQAYDNNALPIGQGQTISQPYIVAKMTELLALTPETKVLEIGTALVIKPQCSPNWLIMCLLLSGSKPCNGMRKDA